jgi:hypothetical protein
MKRYVANEEKNWAELRKSLCELIEAIKKQPNDHKRAKAQADAIIEKSNHIKEK